MQKSNRGHTMMGRDRGEARERDCEQEKIIKWEEGNKQRVMRMEKRVF